MPNEYVYTPPALMSLSNPDTVVTEERLYQFYQQILPYLGGMPDILANKFSKADLYSTDEKLIGRWIDGKPLYQKVKVYDSPLTVGAIGGAGTTLDTIANIETLVNAWCIGSSFSAKTRVENFELSGNNIQGMSLYSSVPIKASILQYTKTTDSAVEIGDDTDYSTTEKIVGTWIDGKPIWQKTGEFTPTIHGINRFDLTDLSIEMPISVRALCFHSGGEIQTLDAMTPSAIAYSIAVSLFADQLYLNIGEKTATPTKVIATIQYTKTSS